MAFDLRIFGADVKSKAVIISAQDRTNVYFDIPSEADRSPVAAYGTPGTIRFCTPSGFPTRGMYYMPSMLGMIAVQSRKVYLIDEFGSFSVIAKFPNIDDIEEEARITDNGTQLLIITKNHGYIIDTKNSYALTDISSQLPHEGCDSCCFLDGYFIVNRRSTQQFFISNLYNGLVWNALDFASAESSPDNLKAVIANNGYLYLLGELTTEMWVNNGGALFPFDRIQGATITYGLVSVDSLGIINTAVIGLFRDRYGMLAIGTIQGGQFNEISTADISYIINNYDSVNYADAFVYSLNGRYFYQITFNGNATWLFDFKSGAWSKIASWDMAYSRYRYGVSFGRKYVVSNVVNGGLAILNADIYTEENVQIAREIRFNHVFAPTQNYTLISRLRAWMETGNGILPTIEIPPSATLITASLLYHFDSYPFIESTGALINQSPNVALQFVTVGQTFGAGAFLTSHGSESGGRISTTFLAEDPDHVMQPDFTVRFRYTPTVDTAGGLTSVLEVNAAIQMINFNNNAFSVFRGMANATVPMSAGTSYAISVEVYNNNGYLYVDGVLKQTFIDLATNCYAFYGYDNPLIFNIGATTNDVELSATIDEFIFVNGTALAAGHASYRVETAAFNNSFWWYDGETYIPGSTQQGNNPTLYLQISRDKGNTWGNYMPTELGKRGEYYKRPEWRRLGQARDWVFKLRMTDPVKFVLTDISLAIGEANS